jgi:hypothetical protein
MVIILLLNYHHRIDFQFKDLDFKIRRANKGFLDPEWRDYL